MIKIIGINCKICCKNMSNDGCDTKSKRVIYLKVWFKYGW